MVAKEYQEQACFYNQLSYLALTHSIPGTVSLVPHTCGIDLHFPDVSMLSIFSCACWPSAFPLWKNVFLVLLPIFLTWPFAFFGIELDELYIYTHIYMYIYDINPLGFFSLLLLLFY